MANDDIRLMFLASQNFDSGKAVRGAFLLTDGETKPLEFRCTTPIRPTALQVMLYGKILEQHMVIELIGLPLIDESREVPDLILVKEETFLDLRPRIDIPIVQITKEERLNFANSEDDSRFQFLQSRSGKYEPIILTTHSDFTEDKKFAREILAEVFNNYDLAELALPLSKFMHKKLNNVL